MMVEESELKIENSEKIKEDIKMIVLSMWSDVIWFWLGSNDAGEGRGRDLTGR